MLKKVSNAKPYKYGDTVYYAHPPLNKQSVVVKLDDFDAAVTSYAVIFQFHDQVLITSREYVEAQVKVRSDYWNEKNEEGIYTNFSSHDMAHTVTQVVWRELLFPTKAEALAWQRECIAEMRASMERFEKKLEED